MIFGSVHIQADRIFSGAGSIKTNFFSLNDIQTWLRNVGENKNVITQRRY